MLLSVVIPARRETGCVVSTVAGIARALRSAEIPHEILSGDDGNSYETAEQVRSSNPSYPEVHLVENATPHGFGHAVRTR